MQKLILLFLILAGRVFATVLTVAYVSQAGSGTADGSTSGNSATIANLNANTIPSGTITSGTACTIHFVGTLTTQHVIPVSGTSGNLISYIFDSGAKFSSTVWGTSTASAIYGSAKSYITIDGGTNGVIENTANGSVLANQVTTCAVWFENGSNVTVKNLTVQNMYVRTISSTGNDNPGGSSSLGFRGISFTDTDNVTIDNNHITYCKLGIVVSNDNTSAVGASFTNNVADKCSTAYQYSATSATAVTASVIFDNNSVSNAVYWERPGFDYYHSDGIHTFALNGAKFTNVSVTRLNALTDWGSQTTGCIFIEGPVQTITVANCLLGASAGTSKISEGTIDIPGIYTTGTTAYIYNNTIAGVASDNTGGNLLFCQGNIWSSLTVKNNIFYNGYAAVTLWDSQSLSAVHFDYNDYYSLGNLGVQLNVPGSGDQNGSYGSLAAWISHLGSKGDEANGKTANPVFVSSSDLRLQSTSTLIAAGENLGASYITDIVGATRTVPWDMGAYKYVTAGGAGGSTMTGKITMLGGVTIK